jgi:nucleoside phosphorylase
MRKPQLLVLVGVLLVVGLVFAPLAATSAAKSSSPVGARTVRQAGIDARITYRAQAAPPTSYGAQLGQPIAYLAGAGETLHAIAALHHVTVGEIRDANPGITDEAGLSHSRWVLLPSDARLPDQPVVAIEASSNWTYELKYIYAQTKVKAVYSIAGRQFAFGTYAGHAVVLTSPGGGTTNAAIGTVLTIEHFNVTAVGFVGISGIGDGGEVGDACVASAAVETDQGNWYDFSYPKGDVEPGLAWYDGGQPIIGSSGTVDRLVLVQNAAFHSQIVKSLASLVLPKVSPDISAYMAFITGKPVKSYHPRVLTNCWSASGNQFVTSEGWLRLTEGRSRQAAGSLKIAAPAVEAVDEEDFGAVMTAVEFAKPWFVVRVAVDLARQKNQTVGVPDAFLNNSNPIFGWLESHHQVSYITNYDSMYRNIGLVTYRIVEGMARPA